MIIIIEVLRIFEILNYKKIVAFYNKYYTKGNGKLKTRELLTVEQREYFYGVSQHMDEREILRYYTISDEELQIINKQRGAANRLGFAIQIAYLRFPGRPLSANEKVPDFIVHTIAKQLRILPSAIENYARGRDTTRREHLSKIRSTLHQHLTPSFLENLARELTFVQRKRKFSGHDLSTICIWISQRVASDSLVRLCSQLHAVTGTLMSPEGLNKRFNKKAVCLLKHIFSALLKNKIYETSVISSSSIAYFERIRILDATIFQVPKHLALI